MKKSLLYLGALVAIFVAMGVYIWFREGSYGSLHQIAAEDAGEILALLWKLYAPAIVCVIVFCGIAIAAAAGVRRLPPISYKAHAIAIFTPLGVAMAAVAAITAFAFVDYHDFGGVTTLLALVAVGMLAMLVFLASLGLRTREEVGQNTSPASSRAHPMSATLSPSSRSSGRVLLFCEFGY
jgi:hypothetical protein